MAEDIHEKFKLISLALEASGQGWWEYRPFERTVYLSSGTKQLLGYTQDLDKSAWLNLIHPQDREKLAQAFDGFRQGNLRLFAQELRIKQHGVGYGWFEMKARLYDEGKGQQNMRVVGLLIDIAEKKQAEEHLEALRKENEMMLEAAGEGIFRVTPEGKVSYLNHSARRMFRLQQTPLTLNRILGHEQDKMAYQVMPKGREGISASLQKGSSEHVAYDIFYRPDGTSFPVEYFSNPVRSGNVGPYDVVVTFRDITDRQKAKEAERKLLRHVNERMQELTCLYKITRLTLDTNQTVDAVLTEMVRLLPEARTEQASNHARITFRRKVYESPNFQETGVNQKAVLKVAGREMGQVEFFFSINPVQELENHTFHNTGSLLDTICNLITTFYKRKTAEEARKESNRKYATLLGNLPGMVFRLEKHKFRFVSQGCQQLTGYLPEDFLQDGNSIDREKLVHPTDLAALSALTEKALADRNLYQTTYRIYTADGATKWVWEQGVAIKLDKQDTSAIEGFMLDITEQKQAEASLIESYQERQQLITTQNARLEKMVQDRTRELEESNEQLQEAFEKLKATQSKLVASEKMASLGQLTAGIAHEINNPVNFIGASNEALQEMINDILQVLEAYGQITPENCKEQLAHIKQLKEELMLEEAEADVQQLLGNISHGVARTAEIVKELRTFSRLDEAEKKTVDIHQGIQSALVILKGQYKKDVEVLQNFGDLPPVECYPGKLNQVFMNVLLNAIQAVLERKVQENDTDFVPQVIIHTKLKENTTNPGSHSSDEAQKMVCVEIEDNGPGIPQHLEAKVFDPFFTTKEVGKGVGLGLSICLSIMEQHKGSIQLANKPSGGARCTICLPG